MQEMQDNPPLSGWINGFVGMIIFSGSLPATRAAVLDFDPLFLTVARASIAGLLALLMSSPSGENPRTAPTLSA